MAAPGAIAKMKELALRRMTAAVSALGEQLALDVTPIPMHGRDLDYLHAEQLTAIADTLEAIQQALAGKVSTGEGETASGELVVATDTADNDTMLVREQDGAYVQDLPDDLAAAVDYEVMTKDGLLELAKARGLVVTSRTTKAELIDWLNTSDAESADDGNNATDG